MALWRYSLASVEHIFGSTGEPDLELLAEAAQAAGLSGLTSTQIRDLFKPSTRAAPRSRN
jgi:hypothetical protein